MPLAAVHRIDSPSIAEQVVADIRAKISLGVLLPGQAISVRDIADEHNVRFATLRFLMERLENERLLSRRGDVFTVAPADIDDVRAVARLLNCVESALIRRVCESRVLPDLDDMSTRLRDARHLPWPAQVDEIGAVLDQLCSPIASDTELRVYADLRRAAVRYIGLGLRVMREKHPSGPTLEQLFTNQFALVDSLLEHCGQRDATHAMAAARDFRTTALWISEFSADAPAASTTHSWPA